MDTPTSNKPGMKSARRDGPRHADRSALLLMLTYVEAECRRLGADAAAHHAAMAAALVPDRPDPAREVSPIH